MEEKSTHECKNCSAHSEGPFCSFCGQRYHAHKESFGELVYEFASDFFHFDSRFFKTILPLLFLPGKLTKSYNDGRQRSQFHPIRLYLFSSFVYFLLFFYFNKSEEQFEFNKNTNTETSTARDSSNRALLNNAVNQAIAKTNNTPGLNIVVPIKPELNPSSQKPVLGSVRDSSAGYTVTATPYLDSLLEKKVTPDEYLKQQKLLSPTAKAGYFERIITVKLLKINLKEGEGKQEFIKKLSETFFHNIPKMLFFLLPVFALLLKLLYLRKKQFYYVDHAVLSLHFFSLVFLMLILSNYILDPIFGTSIFSQIAVAWIFLYLLIAMKKLYGQSWGKTISKYIALGLLFLFTVMLTLIGNMAISTFMM